MRHENKKINVAILLCYLATTFALSGCSDNGRQALSGTVTLDGQPIGGTISIDPMGETRGPSTGGAIRDGKFSMDKSIGLLPGTYKVTIYSTRNTGRIVEEGGLRVAELKPIRFNEEGSLEITVKAGGDNKFDIQLTSLKEPKK
ncbi:MAG: hypothetical protein JXM70_26135 [Pirellulales bacterium]|nr:hypothetical protein [Pirellulales bacterium]